MVVQVYSCKYNSVDQLIYFNYKISWDLFDKKSIGTKNHKIVISITNNIFFSLASSKTFLMILWTYGIF